MGETRFYLLEDDRMSCPYLPDRQARFEHCLIDPVTPEVIEYFLPLGFRHFGRYFFRPRCEGCSACVPWRVSVKDYCFSRSARRQMRKTDLLDKHFEPEEGGEVFFELYRLHKTRFEGAQGTESYKQFLESFFPQSQTRIELTFREDLRLLSCGHADLTTNLLSAVYTYYDPAYGAYGLGTSTILEYLRVARVRSIPYVYLGYFVADNAHMNYKGRYTPAEVLATEGEWIPVSRNDDLGSVRFRPHVPIREIFISSTDQSRA